MAKGRQTEKFLTALSGGGDKGFFSTLGEIGVENLQTNFPRWTQKELDRQSKNTLSAPLFIDQGQRTLSPKDPNLRPAFLDLSFGGTHVSGLAIATMAVAVVAAFILLPGVAKRISG